MRINAFSLVIGATLGSVALSARSADIVWNGAGSDPTAGANWDGGVAPGAADTALLGNSPTAPDFNGQTVSWGRISLLFANNIADTAGGAVINLGGASPQLESHGTHDSTIAPAIVATGMVRGNGEHNVTFTGTVTAAKIESHGTSRTAFNNILEFTDEFISIGTTATVAVNDDVRWNNPNHGVNAGGTLELGPASELQRWDGVNWVHGLDLLNLYNGATVRAGGNNVLDGATDLWDRHGNSTFDLNGYSQVLEYIGTTAGLGMNLNFGAATGANSLVWDASHNMNGTYSILNYEQGLDTLEFGQHGDNGGFIPVNLAKITLNGSPYSQANPGDGTAWWEAIATPNPSDDPGRQIAVFHAAVPEPASLLAAAMGLATIGFVRRSTVLR